MGQLFNTIRERVSQNRYVIGLHASERLEERGIMEWQAVAGMADGLLIAERPDAVPNPTVEVREVLPDGTEFKAVWSYLAGSDVAKLVTVHFFDWNARNMRIEGKRIKRTRFVPGGKYVVAVEVEMVVPPDAADEPCYESETVDFLREVFVRAERGDTDWLKAHGKVYELIESN